MSVTIIGNGGVCTRLGKLAGAMNDINSMRGGSATTNVLSGAQLLTRYNGFQTQFAFSPVLTNLLDQTYSNFVTAGVNSLGSLLTQLSTVANNLLQQQVNLDTALPQVSTPAALQVLISQLTAAPYYVVTSGAAAGAQTNVGSPVGTPTILACMTRGDGLSLEYALPETMTFTCTQDQSSGATVNNEPLSVIGQAGAANVLAQNWPLGSGTNTSIRITDATANNSAGNLLQNSDFQVVTNANIPDNWVALVGSVGTSILALATTGYTNGVLKFVGQASPELTSVYQAFNTTPSTTLGAGGTPGTIAERSVLAFNGWHKVSATPSGGVAQISLTDGAGNVLNNDAGVAQSLSFSLTGLSTSYVNINGFFQFPTNAPAAYRIRVRLSTAIDNGKTYFMGHFSLAVMTQIYAPVGPFLSAHSSAVPPVVGDQWTVAVTTNMAATTWQGVFYRYFNVQQVIGNYPNLSLRVPTNSSGATLINANLIV